MKFAMIVATLITAIIVLIQPATYGHWVHYDWPPCNGECPANYSELSQAHIAPATDTAPFYMAFIRYQESQGSAYHRRLAEQSDMRPGIGFTRPTDQIAFIALATWLITYEAIDLCQRSRFGRGDNHKHKAGVTEWRFIRRQLLRLDSWPQPSTKQHAKHKKKTHSFIIYPKPRQTKKSEIVSAFLTLPAIMFTISHHNAISTGNNADWGAVVSANLDEFAAIAFAFLATTLYLYNINGAKSGFRRRDNFASFCLLIITYFMFFALHLFASAS